MYAFVHGKDVITSMAKAYEDSLLDTVEGQIFVGRGDYVATNSYGEQSVLCEEYANQMVKVKAVSNPTFKKESPFVQEHIQHMMQASGLQQEEDTDYINGRQNGWNNPINETYNG